VVIALLTDWYHVMVVPSAPALASDIFGIPIGMTNCTWDAVDTVITMIVLLAGVVGSNSILILH